MSTMGITSIFFPGYNGQPVPNRLFKHEQPSGIAVIFPGLRYTCDMPLLYYLTQVSIHYDLDVLQLHSDYSVEPVKSLSPAERLQAMVIDAQAALDAAYRDKGYAKLILAGKSIGTLQLAMLLSSGMITEAACIWITPLLHYPFVVDAALQHASPELVVASRADDTFEPDSMEQLHKQPNIQALLFEEADHSLLVPQNPLRSIEILRQVVHGYHDFSGGLFH